MKNMKFEFVDSEELGRDSRYYQWLLKRGATTVLTRTKLDYCLEHGYRKYPDENGEKDNITDDQFGILCYLDSMYVDDFIRPGCERFWDDDFKNKYRSDILKVKREKEIYWKGHSFINPEEYI